MIAACAMALTLAVTGPVGAQQPDPDAADAGPEPVAAPTPPPETAPSPPGDQARGWLRRPQPGHRPVIDWTGRTLASGARIVLATIFYPFRKAVYLNYRYDLINRTKAVFYNDAETFAVLPTLSVQPDLSAIYGAKILHKDLFGNAESVEVSAKRGSDTHAHYELAAGLPSIGGGSLFARFRTRFEDRSNRLFQGIGNGPVADTGMSLDPRDAAVLTRFRQERTLLTATAGTKLGRFLALGLSATYNRRRFSELEMDDPDVSTGSVYDTSQLTGFSAGVNTLELSVELDIDTRDYGGKTGRGLYATTFVGGVPKTEDASYLHYGLDVAYYLTAFRRDRVLVFRAVHEAVAGRQGEIPFTDLPRLGGVSLLRGYRGGQFRDKRLMHGSLEYRYPIHHFISGAMFFDVGKVGRTYDELATKDNWHAGYGGGLLLHSFDDLTLRFDVAQGDGVHVFFSADVFDAFRNRNQNL